MSCRTHNAWSIVHVLLQSSLVLLTAMLIAIVSVTVFVARALWSLMLRIVPRRNQPQ